MLKNEFIKLGVKGNRKIPYFESLGYKIEEDFILVKVTDLNSGSRQLVDVICDFSGNKISSLGIEAIAQSFNNLIHLEYLWLGCEFSFDLSVDLDFLHLLSLFIGLCFM